MSLRVSEVGVRLSLYMRLASAGDDAEVSEIAAEIEDRFGKPPLPASHLIELMRLNYDRKDVDRARGRFADLVCVDEGGLSPDWFAAQFEAAILPVTVDYRGQAWAIGTPGPVAEGFFFDACHDTAKWSTGHQWTANQNPFFLRQGRDVLAEVRDEFKFTPDNVTYQREWEGKWIVDPDALVYAIPEPAIIHNPGPWYGNIFGLDLGWKDHDAIAVMGITQLRLQSHLRHMETKGQQTNHELFARILELASQFPGPLNDEGQQTPTVVYDPAGHATKKTIETYRRDAPKIRWVQADKAQKVEYISWLNTDLRTGTTTVEPGSPMIREAKRLRWKRPGKVAEDADHSDMGDAWLYPWRYARDLLRKAPPQVQAGGHEDPFQAFMRKRREADEGTTSHFERRARGVG